jgi:protoporphyrinogen oxidase
MTTYDYIIVGGGIAGLTINYLLNNKYNTLLLEKNDYLGGRAQSVDFNGYRVKLGAGIGALHNKNLLRLLKIFNIDYVRTVGDINVISKKLDKKTFVKMYRLMIKMIIRKYKTLSFSKTYNLTAKQFIIKYFGRVFFNAYVKYIEYTDFFDSSIECYVRYYPIIDQIPSKYNILYIDWDKLVNSLVNAIESKNKIIKNYQVKDIIYDNKDKIYIIDGKFKTKNIVFAITINTLTNIINKSKILNLKYSDYVGSVPFMRIYSYHKNGHNLDLESYTIVDNIIHKIIKINDKVLMISYSDNDNALYWHKYMDNKQLVINKLKTEIKNILNVDITIDDIYIKFWDEGIHYFKPNKLTVEQIINKLSHPAKNIYVCGEMLSKKQGWVEGAIQSAYTVKKLIDN